MPKNSNEYDYTRTVARVCSLEKWEKIINKAVTDAEAGDHEARMFLAAYLLGAPLEKSTRLSQLDFSERSDESNRELQDMMFPKKRRVKKP